MVFRDTKPRTVKPQPKRIKLPGSGVGDPGSGAVAAPNVKVVSTELATMWKNFPPGRVEISKVAGPVPVKQKPTA